MYNRLGTVTDSCVDALLSIAENAQWKINKGPDVDYETAHFGSRKFIKIPPGGWIKRHSDNGGRPDGTRVIHVVLSTNSQCINHSYASTEQKIHLEQNGIYMFDTWPEHESFNLGDTDRIHLVMDV